MFFLSEIFCLSAALFLPIAAILIYSWKIPRGWCWIALGASCYTVFYILVRMSLINMIGGDKDWGPWLLAHSYVYAFVIAIIGAFLAEGGRWLFMKFLMSSDRSPWNALGFGLGSGGMDAAMTVGVGVLIMVANGDFEGAGAMQLFLSGLERLAMLVFEIGWSLLVMKSIREKKIFDLLLAFGEHFLVVFVATCCSSIWLVPQTITCLCLCILAVCMAVSVFHQLQKSPVPEY